MKITKEALSALLRIVVGCKPPMGKEKRRQNESHLVECSRKKNDIEFDFFKSGLADGSEMYDKIASLALSMGKEDIDLEVVIVYFGGREHITKTISELHEANVNSNSVFFLQTLFSHLLTPVKIIKLDLKEGFFDGVYVNGKCNVEVKNIMFFSEDEKEIFIGNEVLIHFPLYVSSFSNLNEFLIKEQDFDKEFMKSVKFFSEVGLDHQKIPMYCNWIKESRRKYSL